MKARLRNGRIVTGKAAMVFLKVGIAEEVRGNGRAEVKSAPQTPKTEKEGDDSQKEAKPRPQQSKKPGRKPNKKRGRPAKK